MLSAEEKERYSRHIKLEGFGEEAQLKLKSAKVLVIGAGGLGSPALLYLAAAGVGCIGVVDGDVVSLSNLQRQVLFDIQSVGQNKAEVAVTKLKALNNHIELKVHPFFVTPENALDLIAQYDVVLDGSDNFSTRYLVNDACVIAGKPLVYGAIHQFTGQVTVFNYQGGPTYRCLFPEPPPAGEMPGCGEIGVIGVLPGIIGTWQAAELIKLITRVGEVLSRKLLTFDVLSNQVNCFEFSLVPKNLQIKTLTAVEYSCAVPTKSITWNEFLAISNQEGVRLIDVREAIEYAQQNIGGENFPLSRFEEFHSEFQANQTLVFHCQTGKRAKLAASQILNSAVKIFVLEKVNWV